MRSNDTIRGHHQDIECRFPNELGKGNSLVSEAYRYRPSFVERTHAAGFVPQFSTSDVCEVRWVERLQFRQDENAVLPDEAAVQIDLAATEFGSLDVHHVPVND